MRNQEWDAALAQLHPLDLAELVLSLLAGDAVDGETALGVVDKAEVLASLLDGDDVHVASRVGRVGADLAIDLDQALHDDGLGLAGVERILQPVRREENPVSRLPFFLRHRGEQLRSLPTGFLPTYRLRMNTTSGMQSRSLCGPGEALGA